MMPIVDYGLCEGCGACAELYPKVFEMRDEKAWVIAAGPLDPAQYPDLPKVCPYRAISVE